VTTGDPALALFCREIGEAIVVSSWLTFSNTVKRSARVLQ
jgi:hypothetical protein